MTANAPRLDGFYLVIDKASAGPLTEAQLRAHLASGKLLPETFVWRSGMGDWQRAQDVEAFAALFAEAPPPLPDVDGREAATADMGQASDAPQGARADDPWFAEAATPVPSPKVAASDDPFAALMAESEENSAPDALAGRQPTDPFAALSAQGEADAGRDQNASTFEVGEQTRFFMIQAGMTQKQRNPPWKIALFIALFLGVPAGALFAMSQITVEQTVFNEETGRSETVEVTMLSEVSEGISDLRHTLLGIGKSPEEKKKASKRRRRPAKASEIKPPALDIPADLALPASPDEALGQRMALGPEISKSDFDFKSAQSDSARALALYQSGDKVLTGPVGRQDKVQAGPGLDGAPSLAPEVMAGVIARNQKAFQRCTENELRRNPRFKGGKVNLTLTIGSSGMVTQARIDRAEIDEAEIGTCLKQSARRIVFPSFQGEPFDLEVPLVLTAGF